MKLRARIRGMEFIWIFVIGAILIYLNSSQSQNASISTKASLMKVRCKICGTTTKLHKIKFCKIEGCELMKIKPQKKPQFKEEVLNFDAVTKFYQKESNEMQSVSEWNIAETGDDKDPFVWPSY